ncbi:MAG: hypothetical protein R3227_06145 [Reinekea sp.]|nr:hypothetical protein [Reinekea sp.]
MEWKPYDFPTLQRALAGFEGWFLAGGQSMSMFFNATWRDHGDIDVGVFADNFQPLLSWLSAQGLAVSLCEHQQLVPFVGQAIPTHVHNAWVSDSVAHRFEVLSYPVQDDRVLFRRNPSVSWAKQDFVIQRGNFLLVNPLVTLAFKYTTNELRQKDQADIDYLIKAFSDGI